MTAPCGQRRLTTVLRRFGQHMPLPFPYRWDPRMYRISFPLSTESISRTLAQRRPKRTLTLAFGGVHPRPAGGLVDVVRDPDHIFICYDGEDP